MTVRKEETAALIMAVGREVHPLIRQSIGVAINNQTTIVDAVFVFVRKDKDLCGREQLRQFGFIPRRIAWIGSIAIAVEPPIHGIAAGSEQSRMVRHNGVVRRTSIERGVAYVPEENTSLDVRRVSVKLGVAEDPAAGIALLRNIGTRCHAWRH